jgi:hypothetical protein
MMVIVSLDSPSCKVTLFDPVYRWFIGTLSDRPRDYTVWSTLEPSRVDSHTWAGIIQVGSVTLIPLNITLGLYVLSTIRNEPNVVLPNTLLVKFYTKSISKAIHIASVHLLALIPAMAKPTWITLAQVRKSSFKGPNRTSNSVTPWPVG